MPAGIFGDRFIGRREAAWHGLGTVFEEHITASEAISKARLDFEIYKWPNTVRNVANNHLMETDSYTVVRGPTEDDPKYLPLATVGKRWEPIQAKELGRMLDPISAKYPVETAGALHQGKKIFLTLDCGESAIAGEEHRLYYLVTDHRDGGGKLTIAFTPVRVVCQNTLITGLERAKMSIALQHDSDIVADAQWATDLFGQMANAKEEVIEVMDQLAQVKIKPATAKKIIASAYPKPPANKKIKIIQNLVRDNGTADDLPKGTVARLLEERSKLGETVERETQNIQKHKDLAFDMYERFNDEHPNNAQTPWAVYNAVVETEDYRGVGGKLGEHAVNENAYGSIYGSRAETKQRAFKASVALIGS